MSPEQLVGKPSDQRSDIWAWGVVLVEMLTGRNPFWRGSIPATVNAILYEALRGTEQIPHVLQPIVYHALAKDSNSRYQSCEDILQDLGSAKNQIDFSMDAIDLSAQTRSIDADRFKNYMSAATGLTVKRAAHKRTVIRWLVISVIAFLFITSIFFGKSLRGYFQKMFLAASGEAKPAAYEEYLKAVSYMQRYDKPGNLDHAIESLEQATRADPRFALAYAQLGEAYCLKYQLDRDPKWLDAALLNCQKAAEIDSRVTAVYVTLGRIHEM